MRCRDLITGRICQLREFRHAIFNDGMQITDKAVRCPIPAASPFNLHNSIFPIYPKKPQARRGVSLSSSGRGEKKDWSFSKE